MRKLLFVGLILLLSVFYFERQEPSFGIIRSERKWDRKIGYAKSVDITYVLEADSGKFDPEIVKMFHVIFPMNSGGNYTEPDSLNTIIHWIDKYSWSESSEQFVLIETSAGYMGGSCGYDIKAGRYYPDPGKFEQLLSDCGQIDSIYGLKHNGVCDFEITYRWQEPIRYQFDGEELVAYTVKRPFTDTAFIAGLIDSISGFKNLPYVNEYIIPSLQWYVVNLDSSSNPYQFVQWDMDGLFIIHEERPNEFRLVNFLEGATEVDVQNSSHHGFPDIRTTHVDFTDRVYRWDGRKYKLHTSERWVCPA